MAPVLREPEAVAAELAVTVVPASKEADVRETVLRTLVTTFSCVGDVVPGAVVVGA